MAQLPQSTIRIDSGDVPQRKPLQTNLHSTLLTRITLRKVRQEISNIIPRMSIKPRPQPLLIEIMRNQPNTPTQHEQTVQHAHIEVIFGLFGAESAAVAHEVDEADCDAAVDVEDEIVFFRGSHCLDGDGVVEHLAAGEALLDEFFDEFDAEVRVVARFDFVADSGD